MKNKTVTALCVCLLTIVMTWSLGLHADSVTVKHAPSSITTLTAGWDWAVKSADAIKGKNRYIGYSITQLMNEHSHIGWSSDHSDGKTLSEIIYGKMVSGPNRHYKTKTVGQYAKVVLKGTKKHPKSDKKVMKEIAFIVEYKAGSSVIQDLTVSNLGMDSRMKSGTLFWLGKKNNAESVRFLTTYYKGVEKRSMSASRQEEVKEALIMAVAQHQDPSVFPFLAGILKGKEDDEIREKSAFWIGNQETPKAVKLLLDTVSNDRSIEVREKAVFGIYINPLKEADDALIHIAKNLKDRGVRKKAVFWLGQKAVKRSAEILTDLVNDGKDRSIQKAAIFALSQLNNEKGLTSLIKIAKTHKSLSVRKKAIFWLSQSNDPRALDTIINLIQN